MASRWPQRLRWRRPYWLDLSLGQILTRSLIGAPLAGVSLELLHLVLLEHADRDADNRDGWCTPEAKEI